MRNGRDRLRKLLGLSRPEARTDDESVESEPTFDVFDHHVSDPDAAIQEVIDRADELWQRGESEVAFQTLRRARLKYGSTADLQFSYGKKAYEKGQYWAAREALQDAIEVDPSHVDAAELFLDTNYLAPAVKGSATEVISKLASLIPYSAEYDVEAASLILPSMKMIEVVDQRIRMLRYSTSPIARNIASLATSPLDTWPSINDDTGLDALVARLIVVLARDEYELALLLLKSLPLKRHPQRALRVAIRKELRNKRFLNARMLLEHYVEVCPHEVWAHRELVRIKDTPNYLSTSQLIIHGFPFPPRAKKPAYQPEHRRVLYLLHSSLPYHSMGYATRTHGLLRGIRNHGWDVHGVTRLGYPFDMPGMQNMGEIEACTRINGVPYHRLSITSGQEDKTPIQGYVARYVSALKHLAEDHKPFVLHAASNHWNGLAAVSAARELGVPSIYEVRGLWEITRGSRNPDWVGGSMYKYMVRLETDAASQADQVITITNALRDELIHRGVDESKISVVPNGVDTQRFVPISKNFELAARLGVEGKTVVGYVGSILNYEGIALLLEVAGQLKLERNDVAFLFVGDGAELKEYQERVENEGLTDIVKFVGRVPHEDVEEYYSIIDICPFPRLPLPVCEIVSPLKPFEAMAMQKAVVASDVAALTEIVSDHDNGLLFKKGDSADLARVLRVLLDNPNLRTQLAQNARDWAVAERDWTKLSGEIDEIYNSLLLRKQ